MCVQISDPAFKVKFHSVHIVSNPRTEQRLQPGLRIKMRSLFVVTVASGAIASGIYLHSYGLG